LSHSSDHSDQRGESIKGRLPKREKRGEIGDGPGQGFIGMRRKIKAKIKGKK